MSARAARRLAWGLATLALVLLLSGFALSVATGSGLEIGLDGLIWALALAFSGVGAQIASRHQGNAIGWIFLGVAVATGLGTATGSYAGYWVDGNGGSDALGKTAAWYSNLSWIPFILVPPTFLLLLFPDGRLLSPRWRPVAWCAALGIAGIFVTEGMRPGRISDFPQLMNPYGVESPLLHPLSGLAYLLLLIGLVGSSASLILRFRRAGGEQRQQIKWLAFAGAIAAATIPIATVGSDLWGETVTNTASMLAVLGLPVAAGIAILRYRLYDIDLVINRALVYGALTATLVAVYFGGVVTLQYAFRALTGEDSQLAVVASTLVIAALFNPLRKRIQDFIDRRFYRRKYDAAKTLEAFSTELREEPRLEALSDDLVGVVRETMQPTHASLWLRHDQAPKGEQAD
jgi:MFS family permease